MLFTLSILTTGVQSAHRSNIPACLRRTSLVMKTLSVFAIVNSVYTSSATKMAATFITLIMYVLPVCQCPCLYVHHRSYDANGSGGADWTMTCMGTGLVSLFYGRYDFADETIFYGPIVD